MEAFGGFFFEEWWLAYSHQKTMMIKMEHYLGYGVPMVVFMESWSPLLVFRSMFCVLVVKVLKLVVFLPVIAG